MDIGGKPIDEAVFVGQILAKKCVVFDGTMTIRQRVLSGVERTLDRTCLALVSYIHIYVYIARGSDDHRLFGRCLTYF